MVAEGVRLSRDGKELDKGRDAEEFERLRRKLRERQSL